MATIDRYRYIADVSSLSGEPAGSLLLAPDWDAAIQCAHLDAIRRGATPPRTRCPAAAIEPLWHAEFGAPRIGGFQVRITSEDGRALSFEVPREYLRSTVELAACRLVDEGKLLAGQRFLYQISAFPQEATAQREVGAGRSGFAIELLSQPLPLQTASLDSLLSESQHVAGPAESHGDIPFFLPASVLAEAKQLARQAGELETGGVLIGHLCRDTASSEIFSVVTALIAARHAVAARMSFTFTADTWAAVQAAIDLRRRGEVMLAWIHSHPNWCVDCPPERRRVCPLAQPFFSAADVALHRTVFSGPYHVAVLLSDIGASDLVCDAFGYRRGLITPRGYHLTGAPECHLAPAARVNAGVVDTADAQPPAQCPTANSPSHLLEG